MGFGSGDEARQGGAEALAGAEILRVFLPMRKEVVAESTLVDEPEFVANLAGTHEVGACGYIAVRRPLAECLEFDLRDGHELPYELLDLYLVFLTHEGRISDHRFVGAVRATLAANAVQEGIFVNRARAGWSVVRMR